MKKSFVKLLLSGAIVLAGFAFTSCNDLETEITDLNSRIEALEQSVETLQAQITAGAVITNVTETAGGVTVTLSNGKSFDLTNGKDGANGAAGSVVKIGANGNWTIDGVDTGLAAKGEKGDKGDKGDKGETGAAGANGADGCWYVPNAETGCFDKVYVGADGNEVVEPTTISWLTAAVTAVWDVDTLKVYGVEGLPEGQEYVEIYLSSTLKSLAYMPETLLDSRGVIDFYSLYTTVDGEEVFITSAPAVATYRVNPHNADVAGVEWSMLTRGVETRSAAVANITIESYLAGSKGKQGYIEFNLVADGTLPEQCTADEVAGTDQVLASLVATTPEGEVIVSDEAYAQQQNISEYMLINHDDYYKENIVNEYMDPKVPELATPAHFYLVYNESINIIDSLETYASQIEKALPEINVDPTYTISLTPEEYLGADEKTNQQKFVNVTEDGVVTVNKEWLTNGGRAAIGRTPVVKVYSYVNEVAVDSAYLKIEIVDKSYTQEDKPAKTFITKTGEYEYATIGYELKDGELVAKNPAYETLAISWEEANTDIFEVLGMSYEQFLANYDVEAYTTDPKELPAGVSINDDVNTGATATNFLELNIDCKVDENVVDTVVVTFPAKNAKVHEGVSIEFIYTITHNHVWPQFNPDYLLADEVNTVQVKGKKIDGTWSMTSFIAEHFFEYTYAEMKEHHENLTFTLPLLDKDGKPTDDATKGTAQAGAEIGMVSGELAIYLTEPLEVESKDYIVKMTETLCNGNTCEQYYTVRFVSPFVVTLADVELKTLIANADAKNLDAYLTIKDGDGNAIVKVDDNANLVLTDVAKSVYGLSTVPTVNYSLSYDKTGNDTEKSFGGNLVVANNVIIWDNDGTDLQNNKVAHYSATVTFENICKLTEDADVTVLSTANSKGETTELPTPNAKQFIYSVEGDEYILDLGVSTEGNAIWGMGADGQWMTYPTNVYTSYEIIPTDKTSGVIKCSKTVESEYGYGDEVNVEVLKVEHIILYTNMTETTITLYSPNQFGYEPGDPEGMGIVTVDSNWNTLPVEATIATEKQTIEIIENPFMPW